MIIVTQTPAHPHYGADADLAVTETLTSTAFGSILVENTNVTNGTVPEGTSGCYVILQGAGGNGTSGGTTSQSNVQVNGGDGGGGGARVGIVFVPANLLGSTYSVNRSSSPTSFSSGSVTLSAGWGSGWIGGTASASGVTAPLANGGNGATTNSGAGGSSTGGAGSGGGGGGLAKVGGQTGQGGPGGTTSGGDPTGIGKDGGDGYRGTTGSVARAGGGGGGGGYTPGANATSAIGAAGGASYSYVLWV